jgi:Short C-terminal domain
VDETDTRPRRARISRGRRYAVRALLVAGLLLAMLSAVAVWANRQALNEDNWADTSTALLENSAIRTQVAGFLVDQLYANVDVASQIRAAMPPRLKPLAGPAAGGARNLAQQTAEQALGRPRIQNAWRQANRVTARQFVNIAEGRSGAITSSGNAVILDLRTLIFNIAQRLGLPASLAAKIPPGAGKIKILTGDQVTLVQNGASALRGFAIVLPLLALLALAGAVYLAREQRRRTLMEAGFVLIVAGILVLILRRVSGQQVVASLAPTDTVRPAAEAAWTIGTGMLKDVAQALIIIGIPVVLAAWLAGPTRLAVAFRRTGAPWLRDRPDITYGVVACLVALVIAWGPIPATRKIIPVLIMIGLVILGVEALRRQTAEEFPDATAAGSRAAIASHVPIRRLRAPPAPAGDGRTAPRDTAADQRLAQLERLAALHATGALSDEEFAAQKRALLGSPAQPGSNAPAE